MDLVALHNRDLPVHIRNLSEQKISNFKPVPKKPIKNLQKLQKIWKKN